jgi:HSP20 family protein
MSPERDLFANFERMRREMDELFGDVFERTGLAGRGRGGFSPAVDVYYCGEPPRVVVKVDLAGIDPDRIALEVEGRELTIAGERAGQDAGDRVYQRMEIPRGPFRRVIPLGADVEGEKGRAVYEDGVLRIELPVARSEPRMRRVPVQAPRGSGEGGR